MRWVVVVVLLVLVGLSRWGVWSVCFSRLEDGEEDSRRELWLASLPKPEEREEEGEEAPQWELWPASSS